jgi:hypothetical protein
MWLFDPLSAAASDSISDLDEEDFCGDYDDDNDTELL